MHPPPEFFVRAHLWLISIHLLDFDFLAVDGGPVEFLDGVFGVLNVLHRDEGVPFSGDENVVHTAKLVKLPLEFTTSFSSSFVPPSVAQEW